MLGSPKCLCISIFTSSSYKTPLTGTVQTQFVNEEDKISLICSFALGAADGYAWVGLLGKIIEQLFDCSVENENLEEKT